MLLLQHKLRTAGQKPSIKWGWVSIALEMPEKANKPRNRVLSPGYDSYAHILVAVPAHNWGSIELAHEKHKLHSRRFTDGEDRDFRRFVCGKRNGPANRESIVWPLFPIALMQSAYPGKTTSTSPEPTSCRRLDYELRSQGKRFRNSISLKLFDASIWKAPIALPSNNWA